MSLRLQLLIIFFMIISLVYISRRIIKNKINYKFGLVWSLVCIIIMIFAIWPNMLKGIAHLFGIYDPVNMLVFLGLMLVIMVIFSLSMEVSKLSDQNKKLSQELAILRKDTYDSLQDNKKKAN